MEIRCQSGTVGLRDSRVAGDCAIVHDLDLKDAKFGRPKCEGVAAMVEGLGVRHAGDAQRMEEGLVIFDALYARLRSVQGE